MSRRHLASLVAAILCVLVWLLLWKGCQSSPVPQCIAACHEMAARCDLTTACWICERQRWDCFERCGVRPDPAETSPLCGGGGR